MIYGSIYKITNKLNGKSYVGLTTKSILERFVAHKNTSSKRNSAIHKAILKYGADNFEVIMLDQATSKEELYNKEIFWINKLNTKENGYNLTFGGGGIVNMPQEMRQKISKTKSGKKIQKLQGRKITKEWRLKISRTLGANKVEGFNIQTGDILILDYPTQGKEYGFNPSLICAVIKGKRNQHKGFKFRYIADANTEENTENNNSVSP